MPSNDIRRGLVIAAALSIFGAGIAQGKPVPKNEPLPNGLVVGRNSQVEQVATGFQFTEGPAADAEGNVYFSDSPANRILVLPAGGSARVLRTGTRGANGMLFDRQGRLITCNSESAPDGRSVTRWEKDGTVTVLADRFRGKRLNSPNDLCIDSEDQIYFTDPRYGATTDLEQDRMAVYRIEKNGKLTRVIDDVQVPNGILVTPGNRFLYVADNNPAEGGARTLIRYTVEKDRVHRDRVLYDFGKERGIDGMVLDNRGNIYATAGSGEKSGVYVFTPDGDLIQFVHVPEDATNCTFGGPDLRTLYVTAGKSLYRIRGRVPGQLVYPTAAQASREIEAHPYIRLQEAGLAANAPRIVASSDDAGGYAAFPDLCRNADGELVCVFYSGYTHISLPNEQWPWGGRIMLTRSKDEGVTWSKPVSVIDTPHDDRDPHVACLSNGTLVLTWFTTWNAANIPAGETGSHGLFMSTSVDGGRFWTPPHRIKIAGPRWWVSSAPVRELKDGTLILGLYTEDPETHDAWGATIRSKDGGQTWGDLAQIGEHAHLPLDAETDVVRLKDGRLLAALRSSKVNMHFAWSSNEGRTWSEPQDAGFKAHCPLFLRLKDGILVMGHRLPNTAIHWSEDEGKTWQGPLEVDNVIGAYPGLVQLRSGQVLCVYYEEGPHSAIRSRVLEIDKKGARIAERQR
jgi:sialidase-1